MQWRVNTYRISDVLAIEPEVLGIARERDQARRAEKLHLEKEKKAARRRYLQTPEGKAEIATKKAARIAKNFFVLGNA
jgi:hypothetical protein